MCWEAICEVQLFHREVRRSFLAMHLSLMELWTEDSWWCCSYTVLGCEIWEFDEVNLRYKSHHQDAALETLMKLSILTLPDSCSTCHITDGINTLWKVQARLATVWCKQFVMTSKHLFLPQIRLDMHVGQVAQVACSQSRLFQIHSMCMHIDVIS